MDMIVVTAIPRTDGPSLLSSPAPASQTVKHVLFVDPDPKVCQLARRALQFVAKVEVCGDFAEARLRCLANPPDLLITNVRLAADSGMRLVSLLRRRGATTRCVVYGSETNIPLAREVQKKGAFLVWTPRMGVSLQTLAMTDLPQRDRRDPALPDRRKRYRGGRRCTDV